METRLFALQRLTAIIMGPLVLVHLVVILYAVRAGLTAEQVLGRTQGSGWWTGFYLLFVVSVSIHAPLGVRNVLIEWASMGRRAAGWLSVILGLLFLALGLRAVVAVTGSW